MSENEQPVAEEVTEEVQPEPVRKLVIVTNGDKTDVVLDTMGRYECQAILTAYLQRVGQQINALAKPAQPAKKDEPETAPEEEAEVEA